MTIAAKITSAGLAAAVTASGLGGSVPITHVQMGSAAYNPTGSETALTTPREYVTVASGSISGAAQCTVLALFTVAGFSGSPYNVGEIGFWSGVPGGGGSVLFAVASVSGSNFGLRAANAFSVEITMALTGVPSGSVSVTVDPTASVAHLLVANHEAASNPHPQYATDADLSAHVAASDPHTQYVEKAGDTMTGTLTLAGNAASALQAVPKQQLDAAISALVAPVPLAGGVTMTGQYNLSANASSAMQPVPKQQLDAAIAGIVGVTVLSSSGVLYGLVAGSVTLQWGTDATALTASTNTVTFLTAFSASPTVVISPRNPSPDGGADAWATLRSVAPSGFTWGTDWANSGGGAEVVHGVTWIAIGPT